MNQPHSSNTKTIPSSLKERERLGSVVRQRKKVKKRIDNRDIDARPTIKKEKSFHYLYNYQISLLVLPTLFLIFNFNHGGYDVNNILLILTLYSALVVYILDLSNWKEGFQYGASICFYGITLFLCWDRIVHYNRHTFHWSCTDTIMDNVRSIGVDVVDYDGVQWTSESWGLFFLSIWDLISRIAFFYCLVRFILCM